MKPFVSKNWLQIGAFAVAMLGFFATPFDPYAQAFLDKSFSGGEWPHLFGVDKLGRDALSRVWLGAANTLSYAFVASMGTLALSGFLLWLERGRSRVLSEGVRAVVSLGVGFPVVLLGLLLMVFMEREPETLIWAISIATVPLAFRQLRVLWIEQDKAVYTEASRAVGGSSWHVLRYSIWPNLRPQLLEIWKLVFAVAILELSSLSFLGLGGDPRWAELGAILADQRKSMNLQPMLVFWPGLVLSFLLWQTRLLRA
ncbi:MAG: ABC transporter permease subunit [Verrucomicrobiota bacterium]